MKKELGQAPEMDSVGQVYVEKCATAIGRDLMPGRFSEDELAWMEKLDGKLGLGGLAVELPFASPGRKDRESACRGLYWRAEAPGRQCGDIRYHPHQG
jgi:hypothetical protein